MTRTLIASLIALAALAPVANAGNLDAAEFTPKVTNCKTVEAIDEKSGIDCTATQSIPEEKSGRDLYPSAPVTFAPGIVF